MTVAMELMHIMKLLNVVLQRMGKGVRLLTETGPVPRTRSPSLWLNVISYIDSLGVIGPEEHHGE